MNTVTFLGSTSSVFDKFNCYWSSQLENYISIELQGNVISHDFDTSDGNIQLIFVPQSNIKLISIRYFNRTSNQLKKVKDNRVKLGKSTDIKIFAIDFVEKSFNELEFKGQNYLTVFPQFTANSYLQALGNYTFFNGHRKEWNKNMVTNQTIEKLKEINVLYNAVFENQNIEDLYDKWLLCKDKILSNANMVEHDSSFIFQGRYLPENIDYILLYDDTKTKYDIDVKFKKKTSSQIEMTVKMDTLAKDGWYAIVLFDKNTDLFIDIYWLYYCSFSESDWLSLIQARKEIDEYRELGGDENYNFEWSYGVTNFKETYYYNIFTHKQFLGLSQYINSVTDTETRKKIK